MGTTSLNKDQHEAIRMVFQRLCEDETTVRLLFGHFQGDFLVGAPFRIELTHNRPIVDRPRRHSPVTPQRVY